MRLGIIGLPNSGNTCNIFNDEQQPIVWRGECDETSLRHSAPERARQQLLYI